MNKLVQLRDRIGLLRPEVAQDVLQRLTWLLPNQTSLRFINQAIDDMEEIKPTPNQQMLLDAARAQLDIPYEPGRVGVSPSRRFSQSDLAGIAVISDGTYHQPADGEPYVCLLSGRGEIQVNQDGEAWYFRWETLPDEGPFVVEEIGLGFPVGDIVTVARWFVEQAHTYQDH
jgi:hypothetical protein